MISENHVTLAGPMTRAISLRSMTPGDLAAVSQLGIAAKQSWGYNADQMKLFADQLTLSRAAFAGLLAAEVACRGDEVVGYYTLRHHAGGKTELEHLFVMPRWFHKGVGSILLTRAMHEAARRGIAKLTIIADPHSAGFYEKFGAKKVADHQSKIPNRLIPIYEIETALATIALRERPIADLQE